MQRTISWNPEYSFLGTLIILAEIFYEYFHFRFFAMLISIPSLPILVRYYSVKAVVKNPEVKAELDPNYVSGFSDGESSFVISIYKKKGYKTGWHVHPVYAIKLHIRDLPLLYSIRDFFGVGTITVRKADNAAVFSVSSLPDLLNVIIPHFDKYPLLTQKRVDFFLFKLALELMKQGKHLTIAGLHEIVAIRFAMNKGLFTERIKEAFPGTLAVERPEVEIDTEKPFNPNWFTGFVDAEGCFYISVLASKSNKIGYSIICKFQVSQHSRDDQLLKNLMLIFGCGKFYYSPSGDMGHFVVSKLSDLTDKIIPFFENYPLEGSKRLDFEDFCKVVKLIQMKTHLTQEGVDQIMEIKAGMNKGRSRNGSKYPISRQHVLTWKSEEKNKLSTTIASVSGAVVVFSPKRTTHPAKVKISKMLGNQQETKDICRVGSSATIRSLSSNTQSELHWNQWLAGLIDGDGCLLVSKAGYASCEITMGIDDEHTLMQIKQKLGGSVKSKAGVKALRYRLHNRAGMIDLITRINGHIRNSVRLPQLELVCYNLNIPLIQPMEITKSNGWWWKSRVFWRNGTVTYSMKNGHPQLTISASNNMRLI